MPCPLVHGPDSIFSIHPPNPPKLIAKAAFTDKLSPNSQIGLSYFLTSNYELLSLQMMSNNLSQHVSIF